MKKKALLLASIIILGASANVAAACWTYHTSCGVSGHTCLDTNIAAEVVEYTQELDEIFCAEV